MKIFVTLIAGILLALASGGSIRIDNRCPCEKPFLKEREPSVFITFEKYGKRSFRHAPGSSEGIWLRLHNNSIWPILIPTLAEESSAGEYVLFYDVKVGQGPQTKNGKINTPKGRESPHVSIEKELKPGESIVFSVPKEHLALGLIITTRFDYKWEQGKSHIIHQAVFSSFDLPKVIPIPKPVN